MSEDRGPFASSSSRARRISGGPGRRTRAQNQNAGFAIGPILYLLALIGIGAGILFSGYSQILRSNIQITEDMETKNDLNAAATTLASEATLSNLADIFCPPPGPGASSSGADYCQTGAVPQRLMAFASVLPADVSRLPTNYATVGSAGSPTEVGVFVAGSGLKQLDPYGHFYVYCRWENLRSSSASPALMIISAGPDGVLNTNCGNTSAQNDDEILELSVGSAIQRSALWQTDSNNNVYYGQTGSQLTISSTGGMTVPGALSVTGTSNFGGPGVFSGDVTAPNFFGNFVGGTVAGSTGNFSSDVGVGGNFSVTGDTALSGKLDAKGNATLEGTLDTKGNTLLEGTLGVNGTTNLNAALYSTSTAVFGTTTGEQVIVSPLGMVSANSGFIGNLAGDVTGNLTGNQSGGSINATSGAFSGVFTAGSGGNNTLIDAAGNATFQGLVTAVGGFSGTLAGNASTATNVTGVIGTMNGGTGFAAADANAMLNDLNVLSGSSLNMGLIASGSVTDTMLQASGVGVGGGTFNSVTVNSEGIVTSGTNISFSTNNISDGAGDSVTANGGQIAIVTSGTNQDVIDSNGNLGLGTLTPQTKLDVDGNIRIDGTSGTNRQLQFTTSNSERWVVEANSDAEGGGSTGSSFVIAAYDNSGTALGNALEITRTGLAATFTGSVTTPTLNATTIDAGSELLTSTLTGASAYFSGTVSANNISAATGYFTGTVTAASFSGSITGSISIADGSATSPGLFFTNEINTGLFRPGSDRFGFSVDGVEAIELETAAGAANYVTVTPAAAGSAPIIGVAGNTNVGLTLNAAGSGNITLTPGTTGNVIVSSGANLGVGTASLQTGYVETALNGIYSSQNSGSAAALYGTNATTSGTASNGGGAGVYGSATGTANTAPAVYGTNASGSGYAIYGLETTTSGDNTGAGSAVFGSESSGGNTAAAVYGTNAGAGYGGYFVNTAAGSGAGVAGVISSGTNTGYAGYFVNSATGGINYAGYFANNSPVGWTVYAAGTSPSYFASAVGIGTTSLQTGYDLTVNGGIYSTQSNGTYAGVSGINSSVGSGTGVYAAETGAGNTGYGLYALNSSTSGYAIYANGAVNITGNLNVTGTCTGCVPSGSLINLGSATTANPEVLNEPTSGFYTAGANLIDVEANGTQVLEWSTTGERITTGNLDILAGGVQLNNTTVLAYPNGNADTSSLAVGGGALSGATTSNLANVAVGFNALHSTTTIENTAVGYEAGQNITSGAANSFVGYEAGLASSTTSLTGNGNAGFGAGALLNIMGAAAYNTGVGTSAGSSITTGGSNVVIGPSVASTTLQTGASNILIGTTSAVDTPLPTTNNYLNIGGLLVGDMAGISLGIGQAAQSGSILDLSGGSTSTNSSLILPGDTTASRPSPGIDGMIRYNNDTPAVEAFINGSWASLLTDNTSTGTSSSLFLGTATTANPQIAGHATSGFYTPDTVNEVAVEGNGIKSMQWETLSGGTDYLDITPGKSGTNISVAAQGTGNAGLTFSTSGTPALTITNTGSVGIGTMTPVANLQIGNLAQVSTATPVVLDMGGTFSNTAGANPKLKIYDDGTSYFGLGVSNSSFDFITASFDNFNWYVQGDTIPLLTLTSLGNLGIDNSNPGFRMELSPTTTNDGIVIDRLGAGNTNSATWGVGFYNAGATDGSSVGQTSSTYTTGGRFGWVGNDETFFYYPSQLRIGTGTGATPVMDFASDGSVAIGTTTPQTGFVLTTSGGVYSTQNSTSNAAVYGINTTTSGTTTTGAGAALYASATGANNTADALYATNSSASGYAGYFNGAVNITGSLNLTGTCTGCVAGSSTIYLGTTTTANPQINGYPTSGLYATTSTAIGVEINDIKDEQWETLSGGTDYLDITPGKSGTNINIAAQGSGNAGLTFSTNSSPALTITNTGSVGIGTTTPAYPLDVAGALQNTATAFLSTANYSSTGPTVVVGDNQYGLSSAGNNLWLWAQTTGSFIFNVGTTAMAQLNSTGFGIGAVPSDKLDVSGAIGLTTTAVVPPVNGVYLPVANQLTLTTSGLTALTITTTQNVGIGTASPANKLDVNGGVAIGSYAGSAGISSGLVVSGAAGFGTSSATTGYELSANGGIYALQNSTTYAAVSGMNTTTTGVTATGAGAALYASATGASNTADALYATNSSASGYAGYFNGAVNVNGNTSLNGTTTVSGNLIVTGSCVGCVAGSSNINLGSATTANPSISGDVSSGFYTPNADQVAVEAGGKESMQWETLSGATDFLDVTPGKSGTPINITATGSANAAVTIASLGAGNINFTPGTSGGVNVSAGNLNIAAGALMLSSTAVLAFPNSNGDETSLGVGVEALASQSANNKENTAVGYQALTGVTTGLANTAIGYETGKTLTTGGSNILIGALTATNTLSTGSNNILIGNGLDTTANAGNTLNIGGLLVGDMAGISLGIGQAAQSGSILDLSGGSTSTNSSLILPGDTTASRPSPGIDGMIRYNNDTPAVEAFINGSWASLLTDNTSTGTSSSLFLGTATTANPQIAGHATSGFYTPDAINEVAVESNGIPVEQWNTLSGGTDYLSITPGASGSAANIGIAALGSANAGLTITTSGNGGVNIVFPGNGSFAAGKTVVASGNWSTAFGTRNNATGGASLALGFVTTASGGQAVSMGTGTVASNTNSVAMGFDTTASGGDAIAMGSNTVASGGISTAMGNATTASGDQSTAMTDNTIAAAYDSVALGRYNALTTVTSASGWVSTDPLFEIGNGASSGALNDAMVVYKDGTIALGGTTSQAGSELTVNGVTYLNGTTTVAGDLNITGNLTGTNAAMSGTTTVSNLTITGSCIGCTSAGDNALSALTSAQAPDTFDNAAWAQSWSWNSLSTGTALTLSTTSMTTGTLLSLQDTAIAGTSTGKVLSVSDTTTGAGYGIYSAMTASGDTGYAGYFTNSGTGNAGYALYATNTGASNTGSAVYALNNSTSGWGVYSAGTSPNYFAGSVGIGTTTPGYPLDIEDSASTKGLNVNESGAGTVAIYGHNSDGTGADIGVYGESDSTAINSIGVYGNAAAGIGVYGTSNRGLSGFFASSDGGNTSPTLVVQSDMGGTADLLDFWNSSNAVMAEVTSAGHIGIGIAPANALDVDGGVAIGSYAGSAGISSGLVVSGAAGFGTSSATTGYELSANGGIYALQNSTTYAAVSGMNTTTTGVTATGAGAALYASATGASNTADALYATNSSASGYAGYFNGAVNITGNLAVGGDTTLAGTTTADNLDLTGNLVGTNAAMSGTTTVSNLTITGSCIGCTSAGDNALSALTSAQSSHSFDNSNFAQSWTWNTLGTQTALTLSSTSMTTGSLLSLQDTAIAGTSTGAVLNISDTTTGAGYGVYSNMSGTADTGYAGYFTNTGTGSVNYGLYASTSSALGWAGYFDGAVNVNGNTYLNGTTTVAGDLNVTGNLAGINAAMSGTTTVSNLTITGSCIGCTSAGDNALSALTSAQSSHSFDNSNFAQSWTWNTLGTQTALTLSSTSMTTGSLLSLQDTAIAGTSTGAVLNISDTTTGAGYGVYSNMSGTADTGYAGYFTNTGTGSVNYGLYASTSSALGWAGYFDGAVNVNGNTYLNGTTTVAGDLNVTGNLAGINAAMSGTTTVSNLTITGSCIGCTSAGDNALSALTSAQSSHSFDNSNFAQSWTWNTLGTQTALTLSSTSMTTGSLLSLQDTAIAGTSTGAVLNISDTTTGAGYGVYSNMSGTADTGYAGYFTNTGTGSVNYGLYASTSSALGWAGYFDGAVNVNGNTYLNGTTTVAGDLNVTGNLAGINAAMSGTTTVSNLTITGSCIGCTSAGDNALSALTSAQSSHSFDNSNFAQSWTWNTLGTQTALTISSTSMTTGSLLSLQDTAIAGTSTGAVLNISDTTTGAGYGVYSAMTASGNIGYAGYFTNSGTGNAGYALYATNTGASNTGYAGYFANASTTTGYAVYGNMTAASNTGGAGYFTNAATSGVNFGTAGVINSTTDAAAGVVGLALGTSGKNFAVYGSNSSTDNFSGGVYGTSAGGPGVWGLAPYVGVFGHATDGSSIDYGVYGQADTNNGFSAGVFGAAAAGAGIWGESGTGSSGYFISSNDGNTSPTILIQQNSASTADLLDFWNSSNAVMAEVTSAGHIGIGIAPANALDVDGGVAIGSYAGSAGISSGLVVSGAAGFGTSSATTGYELSANGGIYALQNSTTYAAVSGMNTTTTGVTATGAGAALYASATGASNTADALYATNSSASGYAGYFNGAVNITGNLAVGGDTTLAGTTTADNLDLTGNLVGTNAAMSGTTTVSNLTITGSCIGCTSAGDNALSALTSAQSSHSFDNSNFAQSWTWNTLGTQTALTISSTSMTTGSLLSLQDTAIAGTSTGAVLNISDTTTGAGYGVYSNMSGTADTGYAGYFTNTGTGSVNYGLYASTSSALGWAGYFDGAVNVNGNTYLNGTTTVAGDLNVTGNLAGINAAMSGTTTVSNLTITGSCIGCTSAGDNALSALTSAQSSHSFDNSNFAQSWTWNTLGTQTALTLSSTSMTTGSLLSLQDTAIAGTSTGAVLNISDTTTGAGYGVYSNMSGTADTGYAGYFTNTGTGSVNYGLYASTSSTSGYAGYFDGNVNINGNLTATNAAISGTTTVSALVVTGTCTGCVAGSSTIYLGSTTTANPAAASGHLNTGFYTPDGANEVAVENNGIESMQWETLSSGTDYLDVTPGKAGTNISVAAQGSGNAGLTFSTSGTAALTITNTGSVGIGTSVPANKLDVNGGVAIGSYAGSAGISSGLVVSGAAGFGTSSATTGYELSANGGIYALQNSTTYAAVSGMNTTTTGVTATGAGAALYASATGASNTADALYATNSSASGYAGYFNGAVNITGNLAVGGDTTLAGTTTADNLDLTGNLVGTNAAMSGTTTVSNLTITGSCIGCTSAGDNALSALTSAQSSHSFDNSNFAQSWTWNTLGTQTALTLSSTSMTTGSLLSLQDTAIAGTSTGAVLNISDTTTGAGYGVYSNMSGTADTGYAGYFTNTGTGSVNYGLYASTSSALGWAGYFDGAVNVNGNTYLNGTTTVAGDLNVTGNLAGINAAMSGTTTVSNLTITGSCIGCTSAGDNALSALTSAQSSHSFDNSNFDQSWTWNTLSTQTALTISSTSMTTGSLLSLQDTAIAGTSTGAVLNISDTTTGAGYGVYSAMTGTGNSGYAIYATNTGVSNTGYAGYFNNTAMTANYGVYATTASIGTGYAVYASITGQHNSGAAGYFSNADTSASHPNFGVFGINTGANTSGSVDGVAVGSAGVAGEDDVAESQGVLGLSTNGNGVSGTGGNVGVFGNGLNGGGGVLGVGSPGVEGQPGNTGEIAVYGDNNQTSGTNYGVEGQVDSTGTSYAVYGLADGHANTGYAGYFTNTGTGAINYGLYASTSSTTGYALYTVGGSNYLGGTTTVSGSLNVTSNLVVGGTTTLSSTTTIVGTLNQTGNAVLSGTTTVSGALNATATVNLEAAINATALSGGTVAANSYLGLNASNQIVLGAGGTTTSLALSALTSAQSSHSFDNSNFAQSWTWNTLGTQTALTLSSTSMTTGSLLSLQDTAIAGTSTGAVLNISDTTTGAGYGVYSNMSGTADTGYAGYFTNTGTGSVNYGLYASTSSTSGYAGYFDGNVNINGNLTATNAAISGTTTVSALVVTGTCTGCVAGSSTIYLGSTTTANPAAASGHLNTGFYTPDGANEVAVENNGIESMQWETLSSGTDYLDVTPGKAGTNISVAAQGSGNAGLTFSTSGTAALTITNTGSVGIGTSVPANKLDVNGGVAIGSYAGSAGISSGLVVSGAAGFGTSSATTGYELSANGGIYALQNSTTYAAVSGMNTTTTGVTATGAGAALYASATGASNTADALYATNSSASGYAGYFNGAVNITGNLAVGGDTTLAGTTTADNLDLTGNLVGTNAAMSGTTTVSNLTITGSCIGCTSAGDNALSALTSAQSSHSFDNSNFAQSWTWNTLGTQTALTLSSTSMTTGSLLSLQDTAIAGTSTGAVLNISDTTTGAGYGVYSAMTASGNIGYAGYFANTGTGNAGYALYATNTGAANTGYAGYFNNTAITGLNYGVAGVINSTTDNAAAVEGLANGTSGKNFAVYGSNSSTDAYSGGVYGTSAGGPGVWGLAPNVGVFGHATGGSGNIYGVYGQADTAGGLAVGVYGAAVNGPGIWGASGQFASGYFQSESDANTISTVVIVQNNASTADLLEFWNGSNVPITEVSSAGYIGIGVTPVNALDVNGGVAIGSYAGSAGISNGLVVSGAVGFGTSSATTGYELSANGGIYALQNSTTYAAVFGMNTTTTGVTATGAGAALYASATGASNTADALYATNSSASGYAGYFNGAVNITGDLTGSNASLSGTTTTNNLKVTGTSVLSSTTTIVGTLNQTGNAVLSGTTTVSGALNATATVNLDAAVNATGLLSGTVATNSYLGLNASNQIVLGSGGTTSSIALNNVAAATGSSSIDSGSNTIGWAWNSLSTGTALTISTTSMTTGTLLSLQDTAIASTSTGKVLAVSNTTTGAGYAGYFAETGTSNSGYALYATNTGANNTGYAVYGLNASTSGYAVYANGALASTGTASAASFVPTGSTAPVNGMYLEGTNELGLSTSGSTALTITTTQSVGIGTSSPTSKLDVYDTSSPTATNTIALFSKTLTAAGDGGSLDFSFFWTPTSQWYNVARVMAFDTFGYGGNLSFYTKADDSNPATAPTEKMRIDYNGNVGIGTTLNGANALLAVGGGMELGTYATGSTTAPVDGLIMDGNLAVGTSNAISPLTVIKGTFDTGNVNGTDVPLVYAVNALSQGTPSTLTYEGVWGEAMINSSSTFSTIIGVKGDTDSDTGFTTITNGMGVVGNVHTSNGGTITSAYGGDFSVSGGSATIGTGYGVYIGSVAGSTNYGLYQSSASNANYFAGSVGIGMTPQTGFELTTSGGIYALQNSTTYAAVYGMNTTTTGVTATGAGAALYASATGASNTADALYATNSSANGYAGYFNGAVNITGNLTGTNASLSGTTTTNNLKVTGTTVLSSTTTIVGTLNQTGNAVLSGTTTVSGALNATATVNLGAAVNATGLLSGTVAANSYLGLNASNQIVLSAATGGGGATLNGITAATGSGSIDSGSNTIGWAWNSLSTGTALTISSTSMTTGTLLSLQDTAVASTSTGKVLAVSNTTTGAGYAGYFAELGTSNSGYALYATNTAATNTGYAVYALNTSTNGFGIYCNASNSNGCGGNQNWYNSSDIRLKDQIEDLPDDRGIDAVMKLRPVTYHWKDKKLDQRQMIGFIAQEVEPLYPEAVGVGPGGMKSLAYSDFVVPLVKAVQEQQIEIKQMKEQNGTPQPGGKTPSEPVGDRTLVIVVSGLTGLMFIGFTIMGVFVLGTRRELRDLRKSLKRPRKRARAAPAG